MINGKDRKVIRVHILKTLLVVHEETVATIDEAGVTQIDVAVVTKPLGFPPLWWMPYVCTVPAPIFLFLDWKVPDGKSVERYSSMAWMFAAVIVPYSSLCQCSSSKEYKHWQH